MRHIYAKTTLSMEQMRNLEALGRDCSDASLYVNDVSEDGIDNGQLIVNLYPNDGSRQHEIDHDHVIFIYSLDDLQRIVPKANLDVRQLNDGMHMTYRNIEVEPDIEISFKGYSIIELLYKVLCFCLENQIRI